MTDVSSGYAPINGTRMYWESRGSGGVPVIVSHGGFGSTVMFRDLAEHLAADRRVISVDLRGHGRSPDADRPFSFEEFGEDLAALAGQLGLDRVDLFGYSLGGGASLRATIQHPDLVRTLTLVSTPCRHDAWHAEVRAQMNQLSRAGFEQMRQTPMYDEYAAVAPDVDAFPTLMDKTGKLISSDYDWTDEVPGITAPTLLVFADTDSITTTHAAEFFGLLGGGSADGGWDGSTPTPMRLAILPNRTHYNIWYAPQLPPVVADFLAQQAD
ncbi:MAG TPA: alpha/beta hydrolase [Pseudonocardiaceae bacterium]|nr:alpha/beta hydrolase [Pseudonocardiaceae bacterium]